MRTMGEFWTVALQDNCYAIDQFGKNVDGVVTLIEHQAVYDGIYIHDDEFISYSEYTKYVEPLYACCEDSNVSAAISYIAQFFYSKGLRDSIQIREKLFNEEADGHVRKNYKGVRG